MREPGLAEAWGGARGQRDIWPTRPQELLLQAALLADERGLSAWAQIRGELGMSALDGTSEELPATLDGASESLLPALYRNISSLDAQEPLLPALQAAHRSIWLRNQVLLRRVVPHVAALEQAGVPTLLIKGAALIAAGHFDSGLRSITDVDVVVPTERLASAIEVLEQAGLQPVGGVPSWYVRDYAGRFVPSHAFADESNSQIDLHWHVLHASCQPDADADLWAAAVAVELGGVATSALCPTDELLLVILHGLRWSDTPTYRWALDAGQLARGDHGEIDFDRLLEQARSRRVTAALRAGLSYLRRVADSPIPGETLRALRGAPALERLELRAQVIDPRARGRVATANLLHHQYLRRELALGRRASVADHVRLGRRHLGLSRVRDLRTVLDGGTPGPGRPSSTVGASLGTGAVQEPATPLRLEQPLELGDPELAHRHVRHGAWLPEAGACWTAGSQARISLELEAPPSGPLLLGLWADAYLPARSGRRRRRARERRRLRLSAGGRAIGSLRFDAALPGVEGEGFVIPQTLLGGGRVLELALGTPDARSPAELGVAPDDRPLGVSIRRLMLRPALAYQPGRLLSLGERSGDERFLAGGWCDPEGNGRWTHGTRSSIFLSISDPGTPLDLELEAAPFLGRKRRLDVTVLANGRRIGALRYREAVDPASGRRVSRRLALPADALGADGTLLLTLAVRRPSSPLAAGVSQDRRPLGLFARELALVPRV